MLTSLSDRYRRELPIFVKNRQDYESLRQFEEAYWSDFVINQENIFADGRVSVSGKATRWADHRKDRAPFVYVLSKNTHGWYIDEAIFGGSPLSPGF